MPYQFKREPLRAEEADRLANACTTPVERLVLWTLLDTGLRVSELCSLTGENIYAFPPRIIPVDPHLFNYVDVWYLIPFPRYLLNSVIVSALAVIGNVVLNAMAAYALTQNFRAKKLVVLLLLSCMLIPFQATIIPAYLITARIGLLNTYLGLALPLL